MMNMDEKQRKEGKIPPGAINLDLPLGPPRKAVEEPAQPAETAAAEPAKDIGGAFWYPEFQLTFNPFATFDAAAEYRVDRPVSFVFLDILVPALRKVKSLLSAKSSAIIEGERGCGKTAVVVYLKARGEDITVSVSPRNVGRIKKEIMERVAAELGPDGKEIVEWAKKGMFGGDNLSRYRKAVNKVGRKGHVFDIPDNLSPKEAFELADLCAGILDKGGHIILFATLEQARTLKRLDTFARFPVLKFERPIGEFFRELFIRRVNDAKPEPSPLYPFEDEVVDKIAEAADHNPRRFILLCSRLLTEMRERKMDRPLDEKAADELLKGADVLAEAPVDITEALREIMRELGSGGAKWIKVKDIRAALIERYGIDLRPETVGRRLTEMGHQRRYSPDAEYLAQD
jgi:hypothetical protein